MADHDGSSEEFGDLKIQLLNSVSTFLISEPRFELVHSDDEQNIAEQTRRNDSSGRTRSNETPEPRKKMSPSENVQQVERIRFLVHKISKVDGEFIPKLCLYLRHQLNLRTTPNFLMALCAREPKCLNTFECYLEKFLVLPSDWLAVANFSYFYDSDALHVYSSEEGERLHGMVHRGWRESGGSGPLVQPNARRIPNVLRTALKKTFLLFDEFSLAKYNNEASVRRQKKQRKKKNITTPVNTFTLKSLIRLLHISAPVYLVCCILGKRYPSTAEHFYGLGMGKLGGEFDESKAGTRMSLRRPPTWDRALSERGNKGKVWDELFEKNAVPFMAMVRNLRNILYSRCSEKYLNNVVQRLEDMEQIAKSRMSPNQFFRADAAVFDAVKSARETYEKSFQRSHQTQWKSTKNNRAGSRHRQKLMSKKTISAGEFRRIARWGGRLQIALHESLLIAVRQNLPPIQGTSLIILSAYLGMVGESSKLQESASMDRGLIGGDLTKKISLFAAILWGACEDGTILLYHGDAYVALERKGEANDDLFARSSKIVSEIMKLKQKVSAEHPEWENSKHFGVGVDREHDCFPFRYLDQVINKGKKLNSLIVLDDAHRTYSCQNADAPSLGDLPVYLERLRQKLNTELLFLGMNMETSPTSSADQILALRKRFHHRNDFLLTGTNESILKFLAQRSGSDPLDVIERVDVVYDVQKTSARLTQEALDGQRKLMAVIQGLESETTLQLRAQKERDLLTQGSKGGFGLTQQGDGDLTSETATRSSFLSPISPAFPRTASADRVSFSNTASANDLLINSNEMLKRLEEENNLLLLGDSTHKVPRLPCLPHWRALDTANYPLPGKVLEGSSEEGFLPISTVSVNPVCADASPVAWVNTATGKGRRLSFAFDASQTVTISRRLLSSYRIWRFFISSTFLDMNSERNALTLDVFPRLRRWISDMGLKIHLLEVDLRWGITQEATVQNLSTSVCLNEVARCSPFFIGMIGSRYGYVPNPLRIVPDADNSPDEFRWLRDRKLYEGCSVTDLEIKQGIFSARQRSEGGEGLSAVMVFVREEAHLTASLKTAQEKQVYSPDQPFTRERFALLQQHLHQNEVSVITYQATVKRTSFAPRTIGVKDTIEARPGSGLLDNLGFSEGVSVFDRFISGHSSEALTSREIPLDTEDFAEKAYTKLQHVIQAACHLIPSELHEAQGEGSTRNVRFKRFGKASQERSLTPESELYSAVHYTVPIQTPVEGSFGMPTPTSQLPPTTPSVLSSDFYGKLFRDNIAFMNALRKIYVPPEGVVSSLISFACTAKNVACSSEASSPAKGGINVSKPTESVAQGNEPGVVSLDSTIKLVVGEEGSGKSSALAAVGHHLLSVGPDSPFITCYYSFQGCDVPVIRAMLFYMVTTLAIRSNLLSLVRVDEGAQSDKLIEVLSRIAAALTKNHCLVVFILDAINCCENLNEFFRCFQRIKSIFSTVQCRFILSAALFSPGLQALRQQFPSCSETSIPLLKEGERAEVIRRHLALFGKKLQEDQEINEIQGILMKRDAGKVPYLTMALLHLRLFSTFETLHKDIQGLPGTVAAVITSFLRELEKLVGYEVCFAVLCTAYLRQSSGGIMEFNLYRLMRNVAGATRLVSLLSGSCLLCRNGLISIPNSAFLNAIRETYLKDASAPTRLSEQLLVAELMGETLDVDRDSFRTTEIIREVTSSIRRCTRDPMSPLPVFDPTRYSPDELFGILLTCQQAKQEELMLVLIGYFPFLNGLVAVRSIFQRFMEFLKQHSSFFVDPCYSSVTTVVDPVLVFLQEHYHILSTMPSLLRQCVYNMPASFTSIREPLAHATREVTLGGPTGSHTFVKALADLGRGFSTPFAEPSKESAVKHSPQGKASSPIASLTTNNSCVHWANKQDRGGKVRLSVFTSSTGPVRLMTSNGSGTLFAVCCDPIVVEISGSSVFAGTCFSSLVHRGEVTAMVFCHTHQEWLFTGTNDGNVWLWDTQKEAVLRVGVYHSRLVSDIATHPKDTICCTVSFDTTCVIWDYAGKSSKSSLRLNLEEVQERRGRVQSKSPFTTRQVPQGLGRNAYPLVSLGVLDQQNYPISSACFHLLGDIFATASWNGQLQFYDFSDLSPILHDHEPLSHCIKNQSKMVGTAIRVLRFVPSMVIQCVAGLISGGVVLFSYEQLSDAGNETKLHSPHAVSSLGFSSDGRLMVSGDDSGQIRVSYTGVLGTVMTTVNGHRGRVTFVMLMDSQDRESLKLVTGSVDGTIQTWRVIKNEGREQRTTHSGAVLVVACSRDGKTFVTGGADGMALVFTLEDEDVSTFYQRCHSLNTPQLTHPFGKEEGTLKDYRVPNFFLSHDGVAISAIAFALQDSRVVTGVVSGMVFVWGKDPGLNRREGRLLFSIRVPQRSFYPIISLECLEESVDGSSEQKPRGLETDAGFAENEDRGPLSPFASRAKSGSSKRPTTARLLAVCATGEMIALDIHSSAVSLALLRLAKEKPQKGGPPCRSEESDRREDDREGMLSSSMQDEIYRVSRTSFKWLTPSTSSEFATHESRRLESLPGAIPASNEQRKAFLYGEEILGVIPIYSVAHSSRKCIESAPSDSSKQRLSGAPFVDDFASAASSGADRLFYASQLDVVKHLSLAVGRSKLYLASAASHHMCTFPCSVEGTGKGSPETVLRSSKDEYFQYVSRACMVRDNKETRSVFFVLTTTESSVFVCHLMFREAAWLSALAALPTARNQKDFVERMELGLEHVHVTMKKIKYAQLWCRTSCLSGEVTTVDLQLLPSMCPLEPTYTTPDDSPCWFLLLLGTKNGSMQLFLASLSTLAHAERWVRVGSFFGVSQLTCCAVLPPFAIGVPLSATERTSRRLLTELRLLSGPEAVLWNASAQPLVHWVAGDGLGNIYQLRLINGGVEAFSTHDDAEGPSMSLCGFREDKGNC